MIAQPVRLKLLLRQQHLQTYGTFRREYDKAARSLDAELEGSAPSRAQLYRWLSGDLKGLPYPHHCRVLEKMFPGWSAAQLFEPCAPDAESNASAGTLAESGHVEIARLFEVIDAGLKEPGHAAVWRPPNGSPARPPGTGADPVPAAVSSHADAQVSGITKELGQRLLAVAKVRRLSPGETHDLGRLAGNIVELDTTIDIDVANDGKARLSYSHELLNLSNRPLTRVAKELWFEHMTSPLVITPVSDPQHRVAIQRVHDIATLANFACQVSPAIRPGEVGVVGCACEGMRFLEDHYWRHQVMRFTRHLTIQLRHRGGRQLAVCTAVEEHVDGAENSATEDLMWDYDGDDVVIMLTRDYLSPNQAVTLRWAVSNEPA